MARVIPPSLYRVALSTALVGVGLTMAGCGGSQSSQQALDAQLKTLNLTKDSVAPFAGHVTIDGQPPALEEGKVLLVMLYDQKHPEKNQPPRNMPCLKDGSFEFYTYSKGDGVPVGSYVVLFAILTSKGRLGLMQPDTLKNLYDDPDKNAENKDFVIELPPGRTDYQFDLQLAGKEAGNPGPKAIKEIRRNKK